MFCCLVGLYPGQMDGFCFICKKSMVNLETSKKKDSTVFCNTAKISKTMQHLIICERRLKVVQNWQFRSTTNAERITVRRLSQTKQATQKSSRGKVILVKFALINSAQTLKIGNSH